MITVTRHPLTQDKQDKIKLWLISPESDWLRDVLKGEIAALSADASNQAMTQAAGVLSAKDIPPSSKDKLGAAALLQSFLDQVDILRKEETFALVTLTIQ